MYYISSVQRDLFCLPWDEVQPLISLPPPPTLSLLTPLPRSPLDDITRPEGGRTKLRSCSHFSSNRCFVMPSFHFLFIVALVVVLTFYEHTWSHYSLRIASRIRGCGFVSLIGILLSTCYIIHASSLPHHRGWHTPATRTSAHATERHLLYLILKEYNPVSHFRDVGWSHITHFLTRYFFSLSSCSPPFPSIYDPPSLPCWLSSSLLQFMTWKRKCSCPRTRNRTILMVIFHVSFM